MLSTAAAKTDYERMVHTYIVNGAKVIYYGCQCVVYTDVVYLLWHDSIVRGPFLSYTTRARALPSINTTFPECTTCSLQPRSTIFDNLRYMRALRERYGADSI